MTFYPSLGSNLGDRAAHLHRAIEALRALGRVTAVSRIYETEPMEFTAQPWFLNCAVALVTNDSPIDLLRAALAIERQMGRTRAIAKGPRIIDLDLLLADDQVVNTAELTLPHPALHERRFVLAPLNEIAPEVCHPIFHQTVSALLAALGEGGGGRVFAQSTSLIDSPKPAL